MIYDADHYERLEALHACVQANKLIPYDDRGPERWVAVAAFHELNEQLDEMTLGLLDAVEDDLRRGDEDAALVVLAEISDLKRFRTFAMLWDVRDG